MPNTDQPDIALGPQEENPGDHRRDHTTPIAMATQPHHPARSAALGRPAARAPPEMLSVADVGAAAGSIPAARTGYAEAAGTAR